MLPALKILRISSEAVLPARMLPWVREVHAERQPVLALRV